MSHPIPQAGDPAPEFTLDDDQGQPVSLADFAGKKLVLYFYPKDNTPGCTTQAREFQALREKFDNLDAVVVGVSRDGRGSHERFKEKQGLELTLLSDPNHQVHRRYGAFGEKRSYGRTTIGAIRTTVLIDEQSRIAAINHGVKAKGNAERTLALLGG